LITLYNIPDGNFQTYSSKILTHVNDQWHFEIIINNRYVEKSSPAFNDTMKSSQTTVTWPSRHTDWYHIRVTETLDPHFITDIIIWSSLQLLHLCIWHIMKLQNFPSTLSTSKFGKFEVVGH